MGMGGISIWQLLIILLIVLVLFGTKRLKNLGTDLGSAIRGFRAAVNEADKKDEETEQARLESTAAPTVKPTAERNTINERQTD